MKVLLERAMLSTGKSDFPVKSVIHPSKTRRQVFDFERDIRTSENSCLLTFRVSFSLKCLAPSRRNDDLNSLHGSVEEHRIMRDCEMDSWTKKEFIVILHNSHNYLAKQVI